MNILEKYERRMIQDQELPLDFYMHQIKYKGEYFSEHWHEHVELHYIVEGKTTIYCNRRKIEAEEGTVVIVNSNELHAGINETENLKSMVIIFQMDSFSNDLMYRNVRFQSLIQKDKKMSEFFHVLYQENTEKKMGYKLACKGVLYELLTYLIRNHSMLECGGKESLRRERDMERLNIVLAYIAEHYDEKISIGKLAGIMHVSEGRFSHLFKESVGVSPLNYINNFRLKKALPLLQKGKFAISEIAMMVGFDDMNHFGRLFKKYYGMSPKEMRDNSRIV